MLETIKNAVLPSSTTSWSPDLIQLRDVLEKDAIIKLRTGMSYSVKILLFNL